MPEKILNHARVGSRPNPGQSWRCSGNTKPPNPFKPKPAGIATVQFKIINVPTGADLSGVRFEIGADLKASSDRFLPVVLRHEGHVNADQFYKWVASCTQIVQFRGFYYGGVRGAEHFPPLNPGNFDVLAIAVIPE